MDFRNRPALRGAACRALSDAYGSPKMLVLFYAGISAVLSAASMFLSFYLDHEIAGTGGLGNLGLRSVLSTIQQLLPLVQLVVVTGMGLGYHVGILRIVRSRSADHRTLAEGFRRFGPLIRSMLLQGLIYFGIMMAGMYLSVILFVVLPFSNAFNEVAEPILASIDITGGAAAVTEEMLDAVLPTLTPMFVIYGIVTLLLLVPRIYSLRMTQFCLAEDFRVGAVAAMRRSRMMLHRNRFALFRLDLGFWWYYGLLVLASALCYGDMLLPMVGVQLPMNAETGYLLFGVLGILMQFAVQVLLMNRVTAAYAVAYEALQAE